MNAQVTPIPRVSVVVAIDRDSEVLHAKAATLAQTLRLPLGTLHGRQDTHHHRVGRRTASRSSPHPDGPHTINPIDDTKAAPDLLLVVRETRLELRENGGPASAAVGVDFLRGPTGFRRRSGLSRRQPLARAVGLRQGFVNVVDATAGLARDAFLLACLGCRVTAIERSAVLAALVEDGLRRAKESGSAGLVTILERMNLILGDARDVLTTIPEASAPDVVYLDPMYSPKKKSAKSGKEMRICRRLVGGDENAGALLSIARKVARRRVVVKRHLRAPPLGREPAFHIPGTRVRYDVYVV